MNLLRAIEHIVHWKWWPYTSFGRSYVVVVKGVVFISGSFVRLVFLKWRPVNASQPSQPGNHAGFKYVEVQQILRRTLLVVRTLYKCFCIMIHNRLMRPHQANEILQFLKVTNDLMVEEIMEWSSWPTWVEQHLPDAQCLPSRTRKHCSQEENPVRS